VSRLLFHHGRKTKHYIPAKLFHREKSDECEAMALNAATSDLTVTWWTL